MRAWMLGFAALAAAAECPPQPLCERLARPGAIFFLGEAIAARHREGHLPEYRFRVHEALRGLDRGAEHIVIETTEGPPPDGLLLVEARTGTEPGVFHRNACDGAMPASGAIEELTLLRHGSGEASLQVALLDLAGRPPEGARVNVQGPLARIAEPHPEFWRLPHLVPGSYRVTVSAPGYTTITETVAVPPGSCARVLLALPGTGTIRGLVKPEAGVELLSAENVGDEPLLFRRAGPHFDFTSLPPGRYLLRAGASFYPGTPHRAGAAIVTVGPGQIVDLNPWHLR